MGFRSFRQRTPKPEVLDSAPRLRPIAHQRQWSLTEYVCTAGPHDRPFEERHDRVSVALVTAGTFRYRTNTGEGLLYPGAYLPGNAGACYECGHEHSHGDRCLALHMDRELFAEIAFGSSGSNRCEFRAASLPALADLTPISVCRGHEQVPFSSNFQACERHDAAPVYSGPTPARSCSGTAGNPKAHCSRGTRSGIR